MVGTTSTSRACQVAASMEFRNQVPAGVWGAPRIFWYPSVLTSCGRKDSSAWESSLVDFSEVEAIHSSGVRNKNASTPRNSARHGERERPSGAGVVVPGPWVGAAPGGAAVVVVLIASSPWGCAHAGRTG